MTTYTPVNMAAFITGVVWIACSIYMAVYDEERIPARYPWLFFLVGAFMILLGNHEIFFDSRISAIRFAAYVLISVIGISWFRMIHRYYSRP